jgi:hypothetical protein
MSAVNVLSSRRRQLTLAALGRVLERKLSQPAYTA